MLLFAFFVAISFVSVLAAEIVFGFKVGDFHGVVYKNVISPFLAVIIWFLVDKYSAFNREYGKAVLVVVLVFVLNLVAIGGGFIGGWSTNEGGVLTKGVSYNNLSNEELFGLSSKALFGDSFKAWQEVLSRSENDNEILFSYIDYMYLEGDPDTLSDRHVLESLDILVKRKNNKAIPYLNVLLQSNITSVITEGELVYKSYPLRNFAEKRLKIMMGPSGDLPSEKEEE